ncbi:MAG: permease-like cell division protein FtsX [Pseudomonadales bacterium]|nr:permease-like cell division protein FtsX [Pseudomonadales bacterium]
MSQAGKAHQNRPLPSHSTQSRLQQHADMALDSLRRLRQAPLSSLMTISVIGIALLLPTTLIIAMSGLARLSDSIADSSQISVYLNPDVSTEVAMNLRAELLMNEAIADITLITADQALAEFREYSGLGNVLDALDQNPLPAVLVAVPASTDPEQAAQLLQQLQNLPDVASAQLDLLWVQRLNSISTTVQRAVWALGLVLAMAVLFVVGNTIRLAIESRRAEILVVKLVGGTNSFVARPFLYTGFWYGLGGGLLSWLALMLLLAFLSGPIGQLMTLYDLPTGLQLPGLPVALLLVGGSALLGWLGALLSVLQHLVAIEPR